MKSLALPLALAVTCAIGSTATATVVVPGSPADPVADSFGAIPETEFGGDGIPNDAVAISEVTVGSDTIKLGISATQRFGSPTPTNDSMGNFFTGPGESDPGLGLWNFSFYTNIDGGGTLADYQFDLFYDSDAAAGTDFGNHGSIDFNASIEASDPGSSSSTTTVEGSQNLGFGYLDTGIPGIVTPPSPLVAYDPNAFGEYTFVLQVSDAGTGTLLDQVSMSVSAIPEAGSFLLWTLMSGGLGAVFCRRGNRKVETVA